MKAITVRQPWAWAIVHGGKDVENRTRNIAGKHRGPVAIHAALAWSDEGAHDELVVGALAATNWIDAPIVEANGYVESDQQEFYPRGVLIGVVDLVDVHGWAAEPRTGWCSPWAMGGHHHLVLANPRPLAEPIPWRGQLGLWNLPDDVLQWDATIPGGGYVGTTAS